MSNLATRKSRRRVAQSPSMQQYAACAECSHNLAVSAVLAITFCRFPLLREIGRSHGRLQAIVVLLPLAGCELLEEHDRQEHQDAEQAENENTCKHQLGVERDIGGIDHVAEPLARSDKLTHDGAHDRKR